MCAGAEIDSSVIAAGAVVGPRAVVHGSLVGERARIGADAHVRGLAVVGPDAEVGEGNMLDHGIRVAAGERIADRTLSFS